jgi:hypothetical protein
MRSYYVESLRERAIAAYEKEKQLAPYYRSVRVENWVAEEFEVECDPVLWEADREGEVDLGELSLWVVVYDDWIDAFLMRRCPRCGCVDLGESVENLASLGKALLNERTFCQRCGEPYARD